MVIMSIATRVNGVAPPEVPVSDIDLGSWEFWLQDDDVRDGAFATLRRRRQSRSGRADGARV
jgi:methyl-branched lipid omega-hydroxylase